MVKVGQCVLPAEHTAATLANAAVILASLPWLFQVFQRIQHLEDSTQFYSGHLLFCGLQMKSCQFNCVLAGRVTLNIAKINFKK